MNSTGARALIDVLLEQGVDTVFGYPGSAVLDIYDELYKCDKIRHILTCHEQAAAHAADGYARATGRTGVVIATSGPGATNLVTGIATAYMDSSPVVAITGNVKTSLLGSDSFQEVDIAGVTMPVTKYSFIASGERGVAQDVREAFSIAQSGRKGPVEKVRFWSISRRISRRRARNTSVPRRASPRGQKSPRKLSSNARRR